jgi:apolipoprotein N-acyltransferase
MYIPWWAYRKAKNAVGIKKALFLFTCLWLGYEYLHLNWQITWPWLVLGNVFAKHNFTVQWYEITGALGGSLWVLLGNASIFLALENRKKFSWLKPSLYVALPIVFSLLLLVRVSFDSVLLTKVVDYEMLIVQPNVDPYEKFNQGEEVSTLKRMLYLAEKEITENTAYVIMPETAVVESVNEDYPNSIESIQVLKQFVKDHPQIHLITGAASYNFYEDGERRKETARKNMRGEEFEFYNTAIEVDSSGNIDWYHKSKLVPGVEKMPYPRIFSFLEYFSIDMGGIAGSLGSDDKAKAFKAGEKPDVAPLICYESVFPDYVNDFVLDGAQMLLVVTNDGWWRNTDGHKQHMYYACLRAIENRRPVYRSANTGISCSIDAKGTITERTKWWEAKVLKVNAVPHEGLTFYTRYGDLIGAFASFLGVFFFISVMVKRKVSR